MHLVRDNEASPAPQISFEQFLAVDIRLGTVLAATPFPEARKPSKRNPNGCGFYARTCPRCRGTGVVKEKKP